MPSKKVTIEQLHRSLEEGIQSERPSSSSTTSTTATIDSCNLDKNNIHDCIQALNTCARPTRLATVAVDLGRYVAAAVAACESSVVGWKLLVLAVIRRRFHRRAPEAKAVKTSNKRLKVSTSNKEELVEGDGERLFFYCVVVCLYKISKKNDPMRGRIKFGAHS